jgi:hypothetical protein
MNALLGQLHQERLDRTKKPEMEYTIPIRRPTKKAPVARVPIANPIRVIPQFTEEEADVLNRLQAVVDGFDPTVWKNKQRLVEKGKQYKDTDFISKEICSSFSMAILRFKFGVAGVREPKIAIEARTEVIIHSPVYIETEAKMMAENPSMPRRSLIAKLKKEVIQKDRIIKLLQKQLRYGIQSRTFYFNSVNAMIDSLPARLKREKSAFFEKISEKTRENLLVQNREVIERQIAKDPDCPCCLNTLEFNTLAINAVDFCDETIAFKCHNVCVLCAPRCMKCPICRQ